MSPKRAAGAWPKARRRIIGYARSESSPVPRRALSPDTDRRFVQALLARGIADPRVVARLMDEHEHAKDREGFSLAQTLCDRGVIDRRVAARVLQAVRAERALDDSLPAKAAAA